jgi:hypothetical protein
MGCSGPGCTASYCPSRRLEDGGFGFDQADPPDPAATVSITPTSGNLRPYRLYPTPRVGATTPVYTFGTTTVVGFAVNLSPCAPNCLCDQTSGGATVPNATDVTRGKVALAVGANFPTDNNAPTNDVDATTPAYVKLAIAAALATVSVILLANDSSTVLGLILPATTTPSAATIQLLSNDGATILGYVNV